MWALVTRLIPDSNSIQNTFKRGQSGIKGLCLYCIKPATQGFFLFALAVIPCPTLKAHDQHVISDKVGAHTGTEEPAVGFVWP